MSPKTPWGHWPLGRIIEVYPGKDGHVRVAKVQVGKEEFLRPITMPAGAIMNMPGDDDNDEDEDLQRFLNNLAVFHL